MKLQKRARSALKRIGLALIMVLAVGGVAYAALLSNPAVVSGNSISSATAGLQVSTDGVHYADQVNGFDFNNILPGTQAQPLDGKPLALRNIGSTGLQLRLRLDPLSPVLASAADLNHIFFVFTREGSANAEQYSLATLSNGQAIQLGFMLNAGQRLDYKMQVRIDDGAIADTTQPLTIGGINMVFDGLAANT